MLGANISLTENFYAEFSTPLLAIDGDTLAIGRSGEIDIYTRPSPGEPWTLQTTLLAADEGAEYFGPAVALSGETLVISASRENAVYVYRREGTSWNQEARLTHGTDPDDIAFGSSLAISGNTILVGAPWEDSDASGVNGEPGGEVCTNSGAAFVFRRQGNNWNLDGYLKAPSPIESHNFGLSVDLDGSTAVIGAPNGRPAGYDRMRDAFVYERGAAGWSDHIVALRSLVTGDSFIPGFGNSVAIDGGMIVVGAGHTDTSLVIPGSVYVYRRFGSAWGMEAQLRRTPARAADAFGLSVDISQGAIVVGSPGGRHRFEFVTGSVTYFTIPPKPPLATPEIAYTADGLLLSIPKVSDERVEVEFSPDLSPGSWTGIGNFIFAPDDVGGFYIPDPMYGGRQRGFYRAVQR